MSDESTGVNTKVRELIPLFITLRNPSLDGEVIVAVGATLVGVKALPVSAATIDIEIVIKIAATLYCCNNILQT